MPPRLVARMAVLMVALQADIVFEAVGPVVL
jgi:hypothetical protein